MKKYKTLVPSFILFALTTICLALLSLMDYSWQGWRIATCMPNECFCEGIRNLTVKQPSNTWSSLSFVLIGLLIINTAFKDTKAGSNFINFNPMKSSPIFGTTYGITLVVVGLGTMFYHASLTFLGQFFDVLGMYLLVTFVISYIFLAFSTISSFKFVSIYIFINLVLVCILWEFPELRRYIFASLMIFWICSDYFLRKKRENNINARYFTIGLLSFAIGFIIWIFDMTKVFCIPFSLIQGHAIWHILCAIASGCFYLYYRSEIITKPFVLENV